MAGKSRAAFYEAFARCRAVAGTQVFIHCDSYHGVTTKLDFMHTLLEDGEMVAWLEGAVMFPNESRIVCKVAGANVGIGGRTYVEVRKYDGGWDW